jgi:hypothetical protein
MENWFWNWNLAVFRELLQNSDDAQSKAVEIRFETQEYINRKNGTRTFVPVEEGMEKLPDLRIAPVYVIFLECMLVNSRGFAGAQLGI